MKLNDFTRVLENLYTEPEVTKTKLNEDFTEPLEEDKKLNESSQVVCQISMDVSYDADKGYVPDDVVYAIEDYLYHTDKGSLLGSDIIDMTDQYSGYDVVAQVIVDVMYDPANGYVPDELVDAVEKRIDGKGVVLGSDMEDMTDTYKEYGGDSFPELTEGFNDMMNIDKWDLVDWLSEHSQAWEDCCNYFGIPLELDEDEQFDQLVRVPFFEVINWIAEHDMLYDDFQQFFGLGIYETPRM